MLTLCTPQNIQDVFRYLSRHGCLDLTNELGELNAIGMPEHLGFHASGSFGEVWRLRMKNGRWVAVKCLKLNTASGEDTRRLTVRVICPERRVRLLKGELSSVPRVRFIIGLRQNISMY